MIVLVIETEGEDMRVELFKDREEAEQRQENLILSATGRTPTVYGYWPGSAVRVIECGEMKVSLFEVEPQ